MEETHAAVHERGAVVRVDGYAGIDGLDARANLADAVRVGGGFACGGTAGGLGGWRHGGMDAFKNNAPAVIERLDAGDGVGAVVDCWAEGAGNGSHVLGREGLVVGPHAVVEEVEGVLDGEPFSFGFVGGGVEGFVGAYKGFGVEAFVASFVEAGR